MVYNCALTKTLVNIMIGRWRRVGTYSEKNMYGDHAVSFVADSLAAIITRIDVCYYESSKRPAQNQITLTFSPVFAKELVKVCETLGIPYIQSREKYTQHLDWSHPSFFDTNILGVILSADIHYIHQDFDQNYLTRLMKLFDYFNQKMQPHPFPQELLDELKNIYKTADQSVVVKHKHIMTDASNNQEAQHQFSRRERKTLCEILGSKEQKISDELIANLIEGDNPNESGYLFSPLTYAVLRQSSKRALEVMLVYNADPFRRPLKTFWRETNISKGMKQYAVESFSPYELAFAYGQHEKGNLIIDEFSWLTRRIIPGDDSRKKLTVTQTKSECTDNSISPIFRFSAEQSIYTRMMRISCLNRTEMAKERNTVFQLFKNNFETVDDVSKHELTNIFASEFSGEKYIDIIYDGNRIIGFNLFAIVNPKNHKYVTFVLCDYAALAPEYRGFGLMIFLSFRLAYIMQLIHPERLLGLYFSALHYNSYRLVLDFKHYPKYQSAVMDSIIKDILDTIYPESYRYHHLLTHYIVESLRVKTSRADDRKLPLNELFYSREILGLDDTQRRKVKNRAAPVAFIVGDDNTLFMQNVARHHGIDFDAHIAEYAKLFQKLLYPDSGDVYIPVTKFSVFMRKSDALFRSTATHADTNRPPQSLTKL